MGVKDKHIHRIQAPKRLDRGRSGIATGGPHNGNPLARARQSRLKQLANQLHGEIFERQGGAVKQLEQEMPLIQLHQRRARGMAKALIGPRNDIAKFGFGECIADKGPHHAKGHLFIRLARHRGNLRGIQGGNGFGQIQPTIAGKPRQHGLFKA